MTKRKPLVVVTRKLPDAVETRMMELFNTRLNATDEAMTGGATDRGREAGGSAGADGDRPDRQSRHHAGGRAVEADRQFRHRRRQYRCRNGGGARHHRHQHAGRLDRGYGRHDHGAHHGGIAAADRRREGDRRRQFMAGWSPTWMLGHRMWGKRLGIIGMGRIGTRGRPARQSFRACKSIITTGSRFCPRWKRSWRRPIGKASTRCWRGWISSRSTARIRRRPIICSRRGG